MTLSQNIFLEVVLTIPGGETNADQLFPYIGQLSFAMAPTGQGSKTCVLPGGDGGRLESGPCPKDGSQLFSIFP